MRRRVAAAQSCAEVAEQPERDQRRDHDDAGPGLAVTASNGSAAPVENDSADVHAA
jgi:hypothetical protein